MISTVTLTFDLTYTNPATGALEPRGIVTDSTDYAGLGIDLLADQAKGLGVITFNGDVIVDKNIIADPMIDLQNWEGLNPGVTPVFYFPLELDLNGNVANGVYTFQYSLRLNGICDFMSITLPSTAVSDTGKYANFLIPGNTLTMDPSGDPVTILTVGPESGGEFTLTLSGLLNDTDGSSTFDITNLQLSGVYTYSGCTQTTADVSFTYDCEVGNSGSWAVANTTNLASNEVVSTLNCTVSYPSWTALTPTFNPQVVLTSLPYPSAPNTETPLATGTYTVSLTQQILQTQTDGLILQYSTSVIKEFAVSCAGTLCGLIPCIENLRAAHAAELVRNKVSKYQVYVDNVLMYYIEALNYKACGELAKYKETIALLQTQLDASGCECACCDDETYYWVSNNSGVSVIESLIASFQFRLFDGIPAEDQDITQGVEVGALWEDFNTGYLYRCTVNTEGAAVWEEYYAPGGTPTAAEIPADGSSHAILNAVTVQLQLDQADLALENIQNDALYNAVNGLTKTGNDVGLGGDLDGDTTIDKQGHLFQINSEGDVARFAVLPSNQIQIKQYGGGVVTGTPTYSLAVDVDGKIIETELYVPNPKIYAAKLSQVGAGTPTATVYFNDTTLTFAWSKDDSGDYYVTASGPVGNATAFLNGGNAGASGESVIYNMVQVNATTFRVTTWDTVAGFLADGFIANATVEIRIYA